MMDARSTQNHVLYVIEDITQQIDTPVELLRILFDRPDVDRNALGELVPQCNHNRIFDTGAKNAPPDHEVA